MGLKGHLPKVRRGFSVRLVNRSTGPTLAILLSLLFAIPIFFGFDLERSGTKRRCSLKSIFKEKNVSMITFLLKIDVQFYKNVI